MACECGFGAVLHQEVEAGNGSRRRNGCGATGGRERVFPEQATCGAGEEEAGAAAPTPAFIGAD
jgi:hypothetical protein